MEEALTTAAIDYPEPNALVTHHQHWEVRMSRFLLPVAVVLLALAFGSTTNAADRIDVEAAKLQVDLAQVDVQIAVVKAKQQRINVERLEQLVKKAVATTSEFEAAKLDLQLAELHVKAAEIKLAQAKLMLERVEQNFKSGR